MKRRDWMLYVVIALVFGVGWGLVSIESHNWTVAGLWLLAGLSVAGVIIFRSRLIWIFRGKACQDCGAIMVDRKAHERFHQRVNRADRNSAGWERIG